MNVKIELLEKTIKNPLHTVLVLGGYGTFGGRISKALSLKGHHVIITGRHFHQAQNMKQEILAADADARVTVSCFDVSSELKLQLSKLKPDLVIHTCGPFQNQDTQTAQTIINAGIHYIDLSDDRQYMQKMHALNDLAKAKGAVAITAASTVPALSSAVLTHLQHKFDITKFKSVKIGISPGQKTDRGLATTQAVLSYIGKPSEPFKGSSKPRYGFQDTYLQKYPNIRSRLMGNCEAPDLDCLHSEFDIEKLNFSAGMESKLLHGLIWLGSWLVRLKLPMKPVNHAARLLKWSRWFDPLGTENGGMHVAIEGVVAGGNEVTEKTWFIEATGNQGPQIPAIPAILMAEKILNNELEPGVKVCVNLIKLEEYQSALNQFDSSRFRSYLQ